MARAPRNYQKEYKDYQGKPEQIARRSSRNKARRAMEAAGRVKKGDGKEVDHKNYNAKDNSPKNLRVVSKEVNRRKQPPRSGK